MSDEIFHVIDSLREARIARGLSQTELSKLAGVPQAQISRIEAKAVDLRLSSLMAIAHALDMEVTIAPRKALPAIRSIARQASARTLPLQTVGKELQNLQETIRALQVANPEAPYLDDLKKTYAGIQSLKIDVHYLKYLRAIRKTLEQANASEEPWGAVIEAMRDMQTLRTRIVHAPKPEPSDLPRPAYTLDGDDD
ncbi:hypothetical protein N185_15930 [Sinorhizobium sp. GW3]|nr:hypothetical protein N185_15930 [Sinorhizobium sp. GW3]